MKPPLLQTHWYNRINFDPHGHANQIEGYHLRAYDPRTGRTLWLRLTLSGDATKRGGSVRAVFVDPPSGRTWMGVNRFGVDRVSLDSERPGASIGESVIEDGTSNGIVRGNGFMLTWTLKVEPIMPAYMPMGSEKLYHAPLLATKWVSTMPLGRVTGKIGVWTGAHQEDGHTRDSSETEINIESWTGVIGHSWGSAYPTRYAWAYCSAFEGVTEPSVLELYSAEMKLAGLLDVPTTFGRLVLGQETYRFDTFRTKLRAKSSFGPERWVFELEGPDGSLRGRVSARNDVAYGMVLDAPNGQQTHAAISPLADVELLLHPRVGRARELSSSAGVLEVGQHGDRGGIDVVL